MVDEEIRKACLEDRLEQDAILEKEMEKKRASGEIPTNEEIIKMIPSKAVREYLIKIAHEFSERDRELLRRYLAPKDNDELETIFEKGRYVSVPHPFRQGDIVASYGFAPVFSPDKHEGKYELGIMGCFTDDKDWAEWDNDVKTRLRDLTDFSDVSTRVEFLKDDGIFSHEHPNPMMLEFACDVPGALEKETYRTKYLEAASELMKANGDGSLEYYEMCKQSYISSPEHLLELLKKIYKNLREYINDFDSFRKLYFPSDNGIINKLNAKQKEEAHENLRDMEYAVWYIKNNVEDLSLPFKALVDHAKRGTFYKEITDEQEKSVADNLSLIFDEAEHVLHRIDNFTKMPDCKRKRFKQNEILSCIKKLKKYADVLRYL